jgi:hypothetical protein
VTMGLLVLGAAIFAGMSLYFSFANKRRRDGLANGAVEGMTSDEIEELGDRSPRYIYTI